MPLITLQNVDYSIGGPLLLEHANLSIEPGERIALIGRNGAGKSTLLKLLDASLKPDDGQVRVQAGVRSARLEQEVPQGTDGSVVDANGDIARDATKLKTGDVLRLRLAKGETNATVTPNNTKE